MKIKVVEQYGSWHSIKRAALRTKGMRPLKNKEILNEWKHRMLLCEHSPIRLLSFSVLIEDVECFVQTHLARHHIGCEKFIQSLRGLNDIEINRLTKNSMEFYLNTQALINISRKRLCQKTHKKTREVWQAVVNELCTIEPLFEKVCVPECLYRGFCPEFECCGYVNDDKILNYRTVCKD